MLLRAEDAVQVLQQLPVEDGGARLDEPDAHKGEADSISFVLVQVSIGVHSPREREARRYLRLHLHLRPEERLLQACVELPPRVEGALPHHLPVGLLDVSREWVLQLELDLLARVDVPLDQCPHVVVMEGARVEAGQVRVPLWDLLAAVAHGLEVGLPGLIQGEARGALPPVLQAGDAMLGAAARTGSVVDEELHFISFASKGGKTIVALHI